jgi:putative sterol carrier protein
MWRRSYLVSAILLMAGSTLLAASNKANVPNKPAASAKHDSDSVPQEVFDGMRESFRADKARGVNLRYQWDLSGPNGGQWWIEVNNGQYKMGRGRTNNPDVTFVASDKTWVDISNGKLKGSWAVMTGRLKIHGSQFAARKLGDIFP